MTCGFMRTDCIDSDDVTSHTEVSIFQQAKEVIQDYEKLHPLTEVSPADNTRQRQILNRVVVSPKELEKLKREKILSKERKKMIVEPKY